MNRTDGARPTPLRPDVAIADVVRDALGLVTRRQLVALGLTEHQRRSAVSRGLLLPVAAGVYRHRAWPPAWRQAVLAAVLSAGDGAVASHMAAAALWGFDGIRPGAVEVTVPRGRNPRHVGGRVHRSRDLVAVDVDADRPIPVTTPARTLLDIAPRLAPADLEQALDGAARDGLVWVPHLRWRLAELRRPGRPGVTRLAALLDRSTEPVGGDSWLEQRALRLLRDAGLPLPRCQLTRRPDGGGAIRLDAAWPDRMVAAEFDGHATHATRRRRQSDGERSARLLLEGWRVLRFTYEDVVERPTYVVSTLRAVLASAAA